MDSGWYCTWCDTYKEGYERDCIPTEQCLGIRREVDVDKLYSACMQQYGHFDPTTMANQAECEFMNLDYPIYEFIACSNVRYVWYDAAE